MEILSTYNEQAAALIARMFLGLLFFFQGYDALFKVKIQNVISTYEYSFFNKGIPKYITRAGIWFTSCTQLICGLLLVLGLFKYVALYLLGANIILASIAFNIVSPMWDMKFVFPRLVLLVFLLIIPQSWDVFTIDRYIFN